MQDERIKDYSPLLRGDGEMQMMRETSNGPQVCVDSVSFRLNYGVDQKMETIEGFEGSGLLIELEHQSRNAHSTFLVLIKNNQSSKNRTTE